MKATIASRVSMRFIMSSPRWRHQRFIGRGWSDRRL
jgi:hypothetical protein